MKKALYFGALTGVVLYFVYSKCKFSTKQPSELYIAYDYVIVGAGSTGAVIAARLSEDQRVNVLLLEAGSTGIQVPWSHIPGIPYLNQKTSIDWQFTTERQTQGCLGMKDQRAPVTRGKVLGGTSVLNYMLHVRCSPNDFDHWAENLDCPGWSYSHVLPYFKKLESATFGDPEYRGHTGPIGVSRSPKTELHDAVLRAAASLGLPTVDDYNGKNEKGFSLTQTTTKDGWRSSTFAAYLRPIKQRRNLHVITNAMVTKVNLNGMNQATGVEFLYEDKRKYSVKASREIVLSAGAIQSPQLLIVSGIGPKSQLESLNIPVRVDLPQVGNNLQDHVMTPVVFTVNNSDTITAPLLSFTMAKDLFQWAIMGTGPLLLPGFGVQALLESGVQPKPPGNLPDLQIYFHAADMFVAGRLGDLFHIKDEAVKSIYGNAKGRSVVTFVSALLQPQSKGSVTLKSASVLDPPLINPNYLHSQRDLDVLIKGLKTILDLIKTKAMQQFDIEPAEMPTPGCKKHKFLSDAYLECLVRHRTFTIYHPTSTCRMGSNSDTAVVDSKLRVFGVKNLRVADASIFPSIPSGNTNVPCIMTGEKAADIIKEDWKTARNN